MNIFKRWALKRYVKHNIQFVYATIICLIAITFAISALAVDKITLFPNSDDTHCGWQKDNLLDVKYDDLCSSNNDWCKTKKAGQYWLWFGIGGIIAGLIGIGFVAVYKYLCSIIYLTSTALFMSSLIMWADNNPYCWSNTADTKYEMNTSMILMVFAVIVQFFNICVAFRIPPQYRKN